MAVAFFFAMTKKQVYVLIFVVVLAVSFILINNIKGFSKTLASKDIVDVIDEMERHSSKSYENRSLSDINKVVIHHSATETGDPWAYSRYHVNKHDWPGIGYHFVIQIDGTIYQTQKIETKSYHAGSANLSGIGICLTGNFDLDDPHYEQKERLSWLIAYLQNHLGKELEIKAHNEYSTKSCPGNNFDLAEIQEKVKNYA
jgi:N-acetylmuramoyl-L-alanine amidase